MAGRSESRFEELIKDLSERITIDDPYYAAVMFIAFITGAVLLVCAVLLAIRILQLYYKRRITMQQDDNKVDMAELYIPTLEVPRSPPFMVKPLYAVPKKEMAEELISEHILNAVQPNRVRIN